jgi:hypothetical protein
MADVVLRETTRFDVPKVIVSCEMGRLLCNALGWSMIEYNWEILHPLIHNCQENVRSPSQVDIKLQNLSSAAAYILQKYHIYYQVCNKENKGPCGHDNQVQRLLVLASGNISKGNAESTTHLNYIM